MLSNIVAVRGAGDLATGVIVRLVRSGFRVVAFETDNPTVIRRTVSLAEAVRSGEATVEGVRARRAEGVGELERLLASGCVPVLVDPSCASLPLIGPIALVDAIIAKKNTGTSIGMAPIVIALGPGFTAGRDVHAVIETNRGHDLGRVITEGSAEADTGVPGLVGGHGSDRVIHAPAAGIVEVLRDIGSMVGSGEPILALGGTRRIVVASPFEGVVRGMIRDGFEAPRGMKIADIDPRCEVGHCFTVSDKARAVAGGVLEAILFFGGRPS